MLISLVSCFIFNLYIATFFSIAALSVSAQCQSDQQQLLLGFKNSLNLSSSEILVEWNQGTDCCSWDGITCDTNGWVIGLDLSNRFLSGEFNNSNSLFRLQHLGRLNLAGNTQLGGRLPDSIGNLGQLTWIELRYCKFTASDMSPYVSVLDLHGNQFQGKIPFFPQAAYYIDYSDNNFHGSILDKTISRVPFLTHFRKTADYKLSISIKTDRLGGKVPKSLANCKILEVLDLGDNQIDDTFPCHLNSTPELRVLVLRSNNFRGDVNCGGNNVTWPMLQIIDLASNSFSGKLPQGLLMTWDSMKAHGVEPYSENLRYEVMPSRATFHDSVRVTMKGLELELVKIQTFFTSIDFSCNKFEGHIPEAIGDFKALYLLNLSNNLLSGRVPSFLGSLPKLEALDLSNNHLGGHIPLQLANLNFLSFLNLSNNELTGRIPLGTQIQSFSEASFGNNAGLCGPPLEVQCDSPPTSSNSGTANHVKWNFDDISLDSREEAVAITRRIVAGRWLGNGAIISSVLGK
ncbi:hypothetical protein GQ457_06G003090 [Hibiscus cannabinus]